MRILLDTHVLIWWLSDTRRVRAESREAIRDGKNQVLVSSASVWEIAIKRALGKLRVPDDIKSQIELERFEMLNITIDHALAAGGLPPHHSDPFDRMIVAQAQVEGLAVATNDPRIHRYEVSVLQA